MKKTIFSLLVLGISLVSCKNDDKDSTSSYNYTEYNLIVDMQDNNQPATVTLGNYYWTYNMTQDLIDIKASEISINNQKYSFETDPMAIDVKYFTTASGLQVDKWTFSQATSKSSFSNLNGTFVYWVLPASGTNLLNPSLTLTGQHFLGINYILSDRYRVQSFFRDSFYIGNSSVIDGGTSYTTDKTKYYVRIDFEKKTASARIYNPKYSEEMPKGYPEIIDITDIPVTFSHDTFQLEATSPKTLIRGLNDKNEQAWVESADFKIENFSLSYITPELTEATISYELDGRRYSFTGSTILQSGK